MAQPKVGEVYSRLTILAYAGLEQNGSTARTHIWLCRCTCGTERTFKGYKVVSGKVRSCGCLISDTAKETRKRVGTPVRHGHTVGGNGKWSPTYVSWSGMINRCANESQPCYPRYGGRGITVCQRWRESFDAFLSDMGERPEGKTLDRIDPNGNYEPDNCRWATAKEQQATKRNTLK